MWGWILGGAAALYLITRPRTQAQQPQNAHINYQSNFTAPLLQAKVGDTLAIAFPSLSGTAYKWGVDGSDAVTGEGEANVKVDRDNNQDPGTVYLTFVKPGSASIVAKKKLLDNDQVAEPTMVIPVVVN